MAQSIQGPKMKYIVFRKRYGSRSDLEQEIPIIFPDQLTHSVMAEVISRNPEMRGALPISAGFVSSLDMKAECHGESETLGLKSRPEDSNLINMFDYMRGIVS